MPTAAINKRSVDAAKPGPKKIILWDKDLKGFGLKITPAGGKIYVYQYRLALPGTADRTPPSLYTLGPHGSPWTPATARKEAERVAALVALGTDPNAERRTRIFDFKETKRVAAERARRDSMSKFALVAERWLDHLQQSGKSDGYYKTSRWAVRSHLVPALGEKPIDQIDADDIQAVINAIPSERAQTRLTVHDTVFAIYKWAMSSTGGRIAQKNVVSDVDRPPKPKGRKRFLTDAELATVWRAAGTLEPVWTAFYRIGILTAKRRSEIDKMVWQELDQVTKEWLIPGERVKNEVEDLVTLSDSMMDQLDTLARTSGNSIPNNCKWPSSGYVLTRNGKAAIGNHSKAKRLLDGAAIQIRNGEPLEPWIFHDLRRTLVTGMQRMGVRLEVTEALLNHTGTSRGGIAGVYHKHDWKPEKREALARWAAHVLHIVAIAEGENVISLDATMRA